MQHPSFLLSFFYLLKWQESGCQKAGDFPVPRSRSRHMWPSFLRPLGSQLCIHKPVVSWVVEVVRWGSPAFAVVGGPLGSLRFVCVCVLGATGLSLPPLTPSLELEGVRPAASCCRQHMRPGSSLPRCSASMGSWQAALPRECLSLHLGMGGLGALELVQGEVGSLVACGAAQGSVLPGETWFFRGWQGVLSGRGVTGPFPCEDGEEGGGCYENELV